MISSTYSLALDRITEWLRTLQDTDKSFHSHKSDSLEAFSMCCSLVLMQILIRLGLTSIFVVVVYFLLLLFFILFFKNALPQAQLYAGLCLRSFNFRATYGLKLFSSAIITVF